jgi:hypothetical protein
VRLARAKTAAAAWFVSLKQGKKGLLLLLQADILGQRGKKDFGGGKEKKEKPIYIVAG